MRERNGSDMGVPSYWKSDLSDIDHIVKQIRKGTVTSTESAGGRLVYLIEYGKKNQLRRTANYSSACGAHDISCYADKRGADVRPCLFLVGGIHGAETEGIMSLLNLISLIETGVDLAEKENKALTEIAEKVNLLIIPCANPDGRARFPFQSPHGMSIQEFRNYAQGTWKNGTLCGWPECKRVHPIVEEAGYLGAYYNDHGINIMHDNFAFPMAGETGFLLRIADEYVPDLTILLHGCANAVNEVLMPRAVHKYFKDEIYEFAGELAAWCEAEQLKLTLSSPLYGDDEPVHSYNLVSAITNTCGEPCLVYECNQGLISEKNCLTYDEIYRHHILLFRKAYKYVLQKCYEKKV